MKLYLNETEVINAIAKVHPIASSINKLTKETGRARADIVEAVEGLKKLHLVNISNKNEVYLLVKGREHCGITTNATPNKSAGLIADVPSFISKQLNNQINDNEKQLFTQKNMQAPTKNTTIKEPVNKKQASILQSIDVLAAKINKPVLVINDIDIKQTTLTKLAVLMSDDIADLLIEIKNDLTKAVA